MVFFPIAKILNKQILKITETQKPKQVNGICYENLEEQRFIKKPNHWDFDFNQMKYIIR